MKKTKFLSLLLLGLLCSIGTAWADTDLCSATLTGISNPTNTTGIAQTGCTMKWSGIAESGDNVITISSSTYHKMTSDESYVQLVLDGGESFLVGDKLTVKASGKDTSKKEIGFSLKSNSGNKATGSASKTETDDMEYTLVAADIESDGSIKIYRAGFTNLRIGSFFVTRPPASLFILAWNSNGGSELSGSYSSGSIASGAEITAPNDPTKDGHAFMGWNSASDGSGNDFTGTMPAGNTTYYAQWEELAAPSITTQPSNQEVEQGETATLTVVATGAPSPACQWYSCTDAEKTGASSISGATSTSYSPSTASVGTFYYYVVVTNSQGHATSNVVSLTVTESSLYYTPKSNEVIVLNNVYDASKTTSGYSKHKAVAWAGTASSNSKKAGDPNNGGAATSSNVACYSIKNNGGGKNISLSIAGVSKITLYHESNGNSYYPQLLLDPSEGDDETLSGSKSVYYNEFYIDHTKSYSIKLQGYDGSKQQDFYVYAVKLEIPYELTITSAGWASMYLDYPVEVPENATAYWASSVTNTSVTLSPITEGQVIPANNGVVVSGTAGKYYFAQSKKTPVTITNNKFKGCLTSTAVEANTKYVLSPESEPGDCVFGLYTGTTLGANKAYMDASDRPASAPAIDRISFVMEDENNATNIEAIGLTEKAVKFIENGRILIKRDGITYDTLGRVIK